LQTAGAVRRLLAIVLTAGCSFPNPWSAQRDYASSLKPSELQATPQGSEVPVHTYRVRAYVDDDYQAQNPRWNAHVEEQIERASALLEAQFGAKLALDSVLRWPRSGSSARLKDLIDQLQKTDGGADVDWVVGFVASLDVFSAAQDQLGAGVFFGKHFVLRGMSSAAELDAIQATLTLIPADQREALVRQRRMHKETAVFLHEWAHTLGAFHDSARDTLMAPAYDPSMSRFSETAARVIGLGLEYRGRPAGREAWAKGYRYEVNRAGDAVWDAVEKQHALAAADQFFAPGGEIDPKDIPALNQASDLERANDHAGALQILAPLASKYPASAPVQELNCAIAQEARLSPLAACRRAAALEDVSLQVLLLAAHVEISSGSRAEALPMLMRAEKKLSDDSPDWVHVAQLELEAGALTAAERAAKHVISKEAKSVLLGVRRTRAFVGFPRGSIDREAEYVNAALDAHAQIDRGHPEAAIAQAKQLAKDFPGAPAAAIVECRARSRGRSLAEIETACAQAARVAPTAFLPQYILGLVHSVRSDWAEAETALKRAIDIDATTREVWQSLAAVQQRRHESGALEESREEFRRRFGSQLTPALWPAGWAARN
jgi:tetratricopeptide (TPR) repeat protein